MKRILSARMKRDLFGVNKGRQFVRNGYCSETKEQQWTLGLGDYCSDSDLIALSECQPPFVEIKFDEEKQGFEDTDYLVWKEGCAFSDGAYRWKAARCKNRDGTFNYCLQLAPPEPPTDKIKGYKVVGFRKPKHGERYYGVSSRPVEALGVESDYKEPFYILEKEPDKQEEKPSRVICTCGIVDRNPECPKHGNVWIVAHGGNNFPEQSSRKPSETAGERSCLADELQKHFTGRDMMLETTRLIDEAVEFVRGWTPGPAGEKSCETCNIEPSTCSKRQTNTIPCKYWTPKPAEKSCSECLASRTKLGKKPCRDCQDKDLFAPKPAGWEKEIAGRPLDLGPCDDCGRATKNLDHASGIRICDDCASGNKMSTEEIRKDLESRGVDVDAFLKRIHVTIERAKSRHAHGSSVNMVDLQLVHEELDDYRKSLAALNARLSAVEQARKDHGVKEEV